MMAQMNNVEMKTLLEIIDLSDQEDIITKIIDMKLICSAGHVYDTENISHVWWKGVRSEGGKCPEVLSYDVMAKPKTQKCNRKLKKLNDENSKVH